MAANQVNVGKRRYTVHVEWLKDQCRFHGLKKSVDECMVKYWNASPDGSCWARAKVERWDRRSHKLYILCGTTRSILSLSEAYFNKFEIIRDF